MGLQNLFSSAVNIPLWDWLLSSVIEKKKKKKHKNSLDTSSPASSIIVSNLDLIH